MRLEGKTIVVTGAASGIGAATLALCRQEGAVAIGLDLEGSDVVCDVADADSVRKVFCGPPKCSRVGEFGGDRSAASGGRTGRGGMGCRV